MLWSVLLLKQDLKTKVRRGQTFIFLMSDLYNLVLHFVYNLSHEKRHEHKQHVEQRAGMRWLKGGIWPTDRQANRFALNRQIFPSRVKMTGLK